MAGILDSKSRIMDTILTADGRRQLANGNLRFSYYSFSDVHAFYTDEDGTSPETKYRPILEMSPNVGDQIVFETDEEGRIVPSSFSNGKLTLTGGRVFNTGSISSGADNLDNLTSVLSSSLDNLKRLRLIGVEDAFRDGKFKASIDDIFFSISDTVPLREGSDITTMTPDEADSFFHDRRFSHAPNFTYLPPVNVTDSKPLAKYPARGQRRITDFSHLTQILSGKERKDITFTGDGGDVNLVTQVFDVNSHGVSKFDIIDYGEMLSPDGACRVFFVGKVFDDSMGNGIFFNVLTLVFRE